MLNGLLQIIKYKEKPTDDDFIKALRQEAVQWTCLLKLPNCLKMANDQLKQHLEISTKYILSLYNYGYITFIIIIFYILHDNQKNV